MSIEVLLVQVLVLLFTAALWWVARRDLASRVPPPAPAADTAELEQLCATLETLVTSLARRLEAVERVARQPVSPPESKAEAAPSRSRSKPAPAELVPVEPLFLEPHPAAAPDPRYASVYALLDAGVFDPVEIARQTGLGRGEVDLILSLRGRRAL